jgi:hypothetical protein
MLKIRELDEMSRLTGLLAKTLAMPAARRMPSDVAVTLIAAKKQMEGLPEVIEDLNLAFNRYLTLEKALTRMMALAEESASLEDSRGDADYRQELDEEFADLARVVAREAGHRYFQGTSLTVADRSGAAAAAKVLSYLRPVLDNLAHELKGQKALVVEAIAETMNFMGIIAKCYPEAEGVDAIRETLGRVRLPKAIEAPVNYVPTFH